MKVIIILSAILYASSLTEKYYTDCNEGAEDIIASSNSCRQFSPTDGYCCHINVKEEDDDTDIEFYNDDDEMDSGDDDWDWDYDDGDWDGWDYYDKVKLNQKQFKLPDGKTSFCYGFSKEGYKNLKKAEIELEREFDVYKVYIYCGQESLKISLFNILILFLIMINL